MAINQLFSQISGDNTDHQDRVCLHMNETPITAERPFEVFIHYCRVFGRNVNGVRIQFTEYFRYGAFHQLCHINGIDILFVDNIEYGIYFIPAGEHTALAMLCKRKIIVPDKIPRAILAAMITGKPDGQPSVLSIKRIFIRLYQYNLY